MHLAAETHLKSFRGIFRVHFYVANISSLAKPQWYFNPYWFYLIKNCVCSLEAERNKCLRLAGSLLHADTMFIYKCAADKCWARTHKPRKYVINKHKVVYCIILIMHKIWAAGPNKRNNDKVKMTQRNHKKKNENILQSGNTLLRRQRHSGACRSYD